MIDSLQAAQGRTTLRSPEHAPWWQSSANRLRVSDPAVRGVKLCAGDPLTREWIVIAIGGHTASAILAREVETTSGSDDKRMFDFAVTHDRSIISSAARLLIQRIE